MSVQPQQHSSPSRISGWGSFYFYNFFYLYIQIEDEIIHNIIQMHHIKL